MLSYQIKEWETDTMLNKLKVNIQYFLPKTLITRLAGKLASAKLGKFTTFLITTFIKHYNVDMNEAEVKNIKEYETFNAFFTRSLKKNARPITKASNAVAMPADGVLSEYGEIYKDAMVQAKGHYYSLNALLGGNEKDSKVYESGTFATVYLSPANYHRVHMPLDGKLEKMVFVPGDLFSVNLLTAANIDNLFAKNERVICFFKNKTIGEFAVVMVGATIVASITTVFAGTVAPSGGREKNIYRYEKENITLKKGEELGRFMLGSTVICVFPKNSVTINGKKGSAVKMGETLAEITIK
jgi:phosphatidylserine decarboxylase